MNYAGCNAREYAIRILIHCGGSFLKVKNGALDTANDSTGPLARAFWLAVVDEVVAIEELLDEYMVTA